jgi:hypothetical protein
MHACGTVVSEGTTIICLFFFFTPRVKVAPVPFRSKTSYRSLLPFEVLKTKHVTQVGSTSIMHIGPLFYVSLVSRKNCNRICAPMIYVWTWSCRELSVLFFSRVQTKPNKSHGIIAQV